LTETMKLFPPTPEELAAKIDKQILDLILGYSGGLYGLALGTVEKSVLRMLRNHNGYESAVSIADLQKSLALDARTIKQAIRTLRLNYHLPITRRDVEIWAKDVLDQVRAEVAVLRAAAGNQIGLEILGQLRNEALNAAEQEAVHA